VPISEGHVNRNDMLFHILWSDPADNDKVVDVHANYERGESGHCIKFPSDLVAQFCAYNQLDLVLRSHECVMAGYQLFAKGQLCTVFSAANYMGKYPNSGACIVIGTTLECTVKVMKLKKTRPAVVAAAPAVAVVHMSFAKWMKLVVEKQMSREEVIRQANLFARSDVGSEALVARGILALLSDEVIMTTAMPAPTKRAIFVVQPDEASSVLRERLIMLFSLLKDRPPDAPSVGVLLMGPYCQEMAQQVTQQCQKSVPVQCIELKAFCKDCVANAVLSVRDFLVKRAEGFELTVVGSDFHFERLKVAYEFVFGRVQVFKTVTSDRFAFEARVRLENEAYQEETLIRVGKARSRAS
jgi:hypothetical protein